MTDKLLDKRLNWEYKGCKIVPVACYRWQNWGKEAEPIDFGYGPRERYWLVTTPDGLWIHCMDKKDCRRFIDRKVPVA